jgi:hypothetical protein
MNTTETLIVYLDDAAYAQQQLTPMLNSQLPTRWILVACAPRITRRIGKWLSNKARENWRDKWCEKLFAQMVPLLQGEGSRIDCVVASGALSELTEKLRHDFGAARVIDARRPKFGQEMQPVIHGQPQPDTRWQLPTAVGSLGAVLVLAAE